MRQKALRVSLFCLIFTLSMGAFAGVKKFVCHGTASDNNKYVRLHVSENAFEKDPVTGDCYSSNKNPKNDHCLHTLDGHIIPIPKINYGPCA